MGIDRRLLTELTVTPLMLHAVTLLRSAIPARATKINLSFSDGHVENPRHGLSEPQLAAAVMLIGVATYHHSLMVAVYGEADERTGKMPEALRAAQRTFAADVRRKLNIEMDGYVVGNDWDGGVTVYR
jgi:hypothetical protein